MYQVYSKYQGSFKLSVSTLFLIFCSNIDLHSMIISMFQKFQLYNRNVFKFWIFRNSCPITSHLWSKMASIHLLYSDFPQPQLHRCFVAEFIVISNYSVSPPPIQPSILIDMKALELQPNYKKKVAILSEWTLKICNTTIWHSAHLSIIGSKLV